MSFDIHTTHRLISLLENGKIQAETLFDQLPIFFAIVNESGQVVRSNQAFCSFVGELEARMLNTPLANWLDPVARTEFAHAIANIQDREFVTVAKGRTEEKSIRWMIHGFLSQSGEWLFCAIGKTLEGGKEYRERLEQLMLNLPQGLLRVTNTGFCTQECSLRLTEMLGRPPEYGESLKEYFGSRILYSAQELENGHIGVQAKIRPYGSSLPLWVEWTLLGENHKKGEEVSLYFSLVAIQAPTIQAKGNKENFEERGEMSVKELADEMESLYLSMEIAQDPKVVLALMHSFKSCARLAGHVSLMKKLHLAEEEILGGEDVLKVMRKVGKAYSKIENRANPSEEIATHTDTEIGRLFQKLNDLGLDAFKSLSLKIWSQIETKEHFSIKELVEHWNNIFESCALVSSIPLEFKMECNAIYLPKKFRHFMNRIVMQLIQNSVSHGYEFKVQRRLSGKASKGRISLKFSENDNGLVLDYRDDGEGFNYEKLKAQIVKKEGTHCLNWSRHKVVDYLKREGVSCKIDPEETSGRGIGIPAIFFWAQEIDAKVDIESNTDGTQVKISLPLQQNQHSTPSWYRLADLQKRLTTELSAYLSENDFSKEDPKIIFENIDPLISPNLLLDPSVVCFLLGEWCIEAGIDNFESIEFELGCSCLRTRLKGYFSDVKFSGYQRYLMSRLMRLNRASVWEIENGLMFEFGNLL